MTKPFCNIDSGIALQQEVKLRVYFRKRSNSGSRRERLYCGFNISNSAFSTPCAWNSSSISWWSLNSSSSSEASRNSSGSSGSAGIVFVLFLFEDFFVFFKSLINFKFFCLFFVEILMVYFLFVLRFRSFLFWFFNTMSIRIMFRILMKNRIIVVS